MPGCRCCGVNHTDSCIERAGVAVTVQGKGESIHLAGNVAGTEQKGRHAHLAGSVARRE